MTAYATDPQPNTVNSADIVDGSIVDADINAAAAIAPSKVAGTAVITTDSRLADQRTPLDNSVTSAKIVDGTIVDADINSAAGIAPSKVAGTAVVTADSRLSDQRTPLDNSVTSAKIVDGTIVDADISASAAIKNSKVNIRVRKLMGAIGFISEAYDSETATATPAPSSQSVYGVAHYLFAGEVITYCGVLLARLGVGAAPTAIQVGIWQDVSGTPTCLAVSSNYASDAMWTATLGFKLIPLTTPYTVPADGLYYSAFLQNGGFAGTTIELAGTSIDGSATMLGGGGSSAAALMRPTTKLKTGATAMAVNDTGTYASNTAPPWMCVA